jgi:molybdopterin-guanine dinucleotide biosynthesis protein A
MNFIVLTGGTNRRFGSEKFEAKIGEKSLLELLCSYLPAGDLIVVGPKSAVPATYVREVPEFSGPLAAIGAGMAQVTSDLVGIFATDMPFAPKIIPQLLDSLINDAALPVDIEGVAQPLAGIYRSAPLKDALATFESLANNSVKSLLDKLDIDLVPLVETGYLIDIDTKEALLEAIALQSRLGL